MKKYLFILVLPAIVGILVGIVVLTINPKAGQHVGDVLYSKGVNVDSYAYAVAKAAPSVVNIYVTSPDTEYAGENKKEEGGSSAITNSASGVIMRSDGYIVTNYHVVPSSKDPDQAVWAMLRTGELYRAFVVGYDPGSGLITRNQMNIREGLQDLIQTDAPINNGNSGGALINTAGELVGINTASFNGYQTYGIGFAVPTKLVTAVMSEIISHGRVIRGYLGISDDGTVPLPNEQGVGVRVGFIDPSGPAAGLLNVGDVIFAVDGRRIASLKELIENISATIPGTVIEFKLLRDGEEHDVQITLAEDRVGMD